MKKIILACLMLMAVAGSALAAEVTVPVAAEFADPFVATKIQDSNMGKIFVTGALGQISLDVEEMLPGATAVLGHADHAAAIAVLPLAATAWSKGPGGAISGGTLPTGALPGVIELESNVAALSLNVALKAPVSMVDTSTGVAPADPIMINSVKSNVLKLSGVVLAAANFANLVISPVIDVPTNVATGSYAGDMIVEITSN